MDAIIDKPPIHGSVSSQILSSPECLNHPGPNESQLGNTDNPNVMFISVQYNKDDEFRINQIARNSNNATTADFVQHVSPLDPNMSSAACYSPSSPQCNNGDISFHDATMEQNLLTTTTTTNGVTHELTISRGTDTYLDQVAVSNSSSQNISNLLPSCNSHLLTETEVSNSRCLLNHNGLPSGVLQLIPGAEVENGVELLITDQVTGISYVSTQEYLMERCLADEQQFLDVLTPTPFISNDLLNMNYASLKPELSDGIEPGNSTETIHLQNTCNNQENLGHGILSTHLPIKVENYIDENDLVYNHENLRRSQRHIGFQSHQTEDQLLSDVQSICDNAVETRARATLPAYYLSIVKVDNDEFCVTARKAIPKSTQFGPVEGLLVVNNRSIEDDSLHLLMDCGTGSIHRMDLSDENVSNWMCFVRKAKTYAEQNLVVTQVGNQLYYVTTVPILPKTELLVGYSAKYAKRYDLPLLRPSPNLTIWSCFECYRPFYSTSDLQIHLKVHDKLQKKGKVRNNLKKKQIRDEFKKFLLECKHCLEVILYSLNDHDILKQHASKHSDLDANAIKDLFSIISYNCEKCGMQFESDALLEIHSLQHKLNNNTVLKNLICPKCHNQFDAQMHLVEHVDLHCFVNYTPLISPKGLKCPVCHKIFTSSERIQQHMSVHDSDDLKPLACDICNKKFTTNSGLSCHLKTHNNDKKYFQCNICKDSFRHLHQLQTHVKSHLVDGKYFCPHCKKIFNEYNLIRKHIRAFHYKRHYCSYCTKAFPNMDKLRMHLLRHSNRKEFLCADCGNQFKRKDKLNAHIKRMHLEKPMESKLKPTKTNSHKGKFVPSVSPTEYHRFIYKCNTCLVGFKRRGMLVNHLAKQHPDIRPDSVPELNLPILRTTRNYYCQYCDKFYKSSSKRKVHILKNHPGQALPLSGRRQGTYQEISELPNPTFSQTIGSVTTPPQACQWCHKQYASKAKLLQHQRKKHVDLLQKYPEKAEMDMEQAPKQTENKDNIDITLPKTTDENVSSKFANDAQIATSDPVNDRDDQYYQDKEEFSTAVQLIKESDHYHQNKQFPENSLTRNEDKNGQFYQIISVSSNSIGNRSNATEINSGYVSANSRLYLLLTRNGNAVVYPPR